MKTRILLAMFLFCVAGTRVVSALPIANSNAGRRYLLLTGELSRWSCGIYYEDGEREVEVRGMDTMMQSRKGLVYVGFDVMSWCTAYAIAGPNKTKFGDSDYSDNELEYGGGANVNLLDYDILSPTLYEDALRINAGAQYTFTESEWRGRDVEWRELLATLTVSIVNDLDGNKFFLPESIALFGGPVFSYIDSSSISGVDGTSLKANDKMGFTAGLEFFVTDTVTFDVKLKKFDSESYAAGLHFHF